MIRIQTFKMGSERAYGSRENRDELPSEVFDARSGDDSGAVAEEIWHHGRVKDGV